MIAFMPQIYEDELCYSWFARYYCHSGYPAYSYALDDLFEKRTSRFGAGFITNRFYNDTKDAISGIMQLRNLILDHTMFPVARFMHHDRVQKALGCMIRQEGRTDRLLALSPRKNLSSLRYCPCCAQEQREKVGEAFWTRKANLEGLDICVKHKCRLKDTDIILSERRSPRLYIAEQEIVDIQPEFVQDGLELQFAKYLTDVFLAPIDLNNNTCISDFLKSKLEGTPYLNVSGINMNRGLLYDDFQKFYECMPDGWAAKLSQVEKILGGKRSGFFEVCQIAYFLGVDAKDLTAPELPEKSQAELFCEKVAALKAAGMKSKQIERMLGVDYDTIQKAGKMETRNRHSAHKVLSREDCCRLDEEILPAVRVLCIKLYYGENSAPQKVTARTVERMLDMPKAKLNLLPKCRNEVRKYEESQEICWARKIVWQYRRLVEEGTNITCYKLYAPLHMKKENLISALPFLEGLCGGEEEERIRGLVK